MSPLPAPPRRRAARRLRRLVALALALAVCGCAGAAAARADGDPASDYLLVDATFLSPFDGHVAAAQATRLNEMVAEAAKRGFSVKVAVIVTPYDLGSVPILFKKPELYAKFLGEEDYYYWQNELLVVMPNGYGIYKSSKLPAADVAAIHRLHFTDTTSGTAMVVAAQTALRVLAARRGITLSVSGAAPSSHGSSATQERVEIGAAVLVALLLGAGVRLWRRRGAAARA